MAKGPLVSIAEAGYWSLPTLTPAIGTAAYTAGDAVGELMELPISRETGLPAFTVGITVIDLGAQEAALDVMFFDRSITDTTDNDELDIADADLPYLLGIISVAATDYVSFKDNSAAYVEAVVGLRPNSGSSVYVKLKTEGTPTYTSTSDLGLRVHLAQS